MTVAFTARQTTVATTPTVANVIFFFDGLAGRVPPNEATFFGGELLVAAAAAVGEPVASFSLNSVSLISGRVTLSVPTMLVNRLAETATSSVSFYYHRVLWTAESIVVDRVRTTVAAPALPTTPQSATAQTTVTPSSDGDGGATNVRGNGGEDSTDGPSGVVIVVIVVIVTLVVLGAAIVLFNYKTSIASHEFVGPSHLGEVSNASVNPLFTEPPPGMGMSATPRTPSFGLAPRGQVGASSTLDHGLNSRPKLKFESVQDVQRRASEDFDALVESKRTQRMLIEDDIGFGFDP